MKQSWFFFFLICCFGSSCLKLKILKKEVPFFLSKINLRNDLNSKLNEMKMIFGSSFVQFFFFSFGCYVTIAMMRHLYIDSSLLFTCKPIFISKNYPVKLYTSSSSFFNNKKTYYKNLSTSSNRIKIGSLCFL